MNGTMTWLLPFSEHELLFTLALLLTKITILLALAWCAHGLLKRANPRWRVLLWRSTGIGMVLLIALAACPPIVSWSVLPPPTDPPDLLASQRFGPLSEPAEQRASRVMHGESTATTLAEDPQQASQSQQEGYAASKASHPGHPSATSKHDAPGAPPVPTRGRSTQVLCAIAVVWLIGLAGLAAWTLVGLRRPVILLPETQVAPDRCEELLAILLHETAHLNARDLLWNAVMHVLSLLF